MHKRANRNALWNQKHVRDVFNCRIAEYADGPTGPESERFTFVLHDLAQPPTAEQVAQGGLAPYVDGIYASALFAANPLADFTDPDTSDGITPQLTERRLYAEAVDALLAREDALGEITFDLTDYLGSIRAWTDASGAILESLAYESYGLPLGIPPVRSRFGFTGREWIGSSDDWFARARYLSPVVGRFLTQDPLGTVTSVADVGGYLYSGNSPVTHKDPLGLWRVGVEVCVPVFVPFWFNVVCVELSVGTGGVGVYVGYGVGLPGVELEVGPGAKNLSGNSLCRVRERGVWAGEGGERW